MASKQEIRRTDVIRCECCGEDYSVTYKRCPFCDGKAGYGGYSGADGITVKNSKGKRVATNTKGGGYGGSMQPLQIVGLALSIILILAAICIVYSVLKPLFASESGSGSGSAYSSAESVSQSASQPEVSVSQPEVSVSQPEVVPSGDVSAPVVPDPSISSGVITPIVSATGITLSAADVTLKADESGKLTATVSPAGCTEPVVWSGSNDAVLSVSQDGTVTNINKGDTQVTVTVTAQVGDVKQICLVRCKPGSTGQPASSGNVSTGGATTTTTTVKPGTTGVVTGTSTGLLIRSGPGKNYEAQATATNGTVVTILEQTADGWYKINYSGDGGKTKTGYASKDFIRAD